MKWFAIASLVASATLGISYLAISWNVHQQTEKRIVNALAEHYAPATVDVLKREDWDFGEGDFSFGGQICFEIDVRQQSGRRSHKVAMVADGDDGGAFQFSREYRSFAECTGDFFRG